MKKIKEFLLEVFDWIECFLIGITCFNKKDIDRIIEYRIKRND